MELTWAANRSVPHHPRPIRRSVLMAMMVTMVMPVTVPMAVPMSVMVMVAALCARDTRLVGILLVQAVRLAVAPGHPIELCGSDLARRRISA